MSNDFYNHGSFPTTGSAATSASMRAELDSIAAGFDKMPVLTGNADEIVVVNASGTALSSIASLPATTGGTGQTSYAVGDLLYASTTTALSKLADVATGSALISGGVGVAPTYGKIGLTTHVSGTLPVANGGTGITSFGTGVATALGINVGFAGAFVVNGGALGTPSSGTLTNVTGLPVGTGISGLGTNVATALAVNIGTAGAFVVNGGALGTPSSGTLTNVTGLPVGTGISGFGTGVATALAVNVGSAGAFVVNGGALGTPSSGTVTNLTGTASININGTVGATTPTTGSFTNITGSANAIISVTDNTNAALRITQLGTGNALLVEDSTNPDSTPFVINSAGNVIRGYTATIASNLGTGTLQSIGSDVNSSALTTLGLYSATGSRRAAIEFVKSATNTIDTQAQVVSNEALALIQASGSDGTAFIPAASISAFVDGTPGTNDMPGRLVFSTTADGAATPTERMRIDSSGNTNIGTTGVAAKLYVSGNAAQNIGALTDAATIAVDMGTANNFSVTLGGNRTLGNPTNLLAGQSGVIFITQDGTGSRTLAYSSFWDFSQGTAPTLTTTANAVDAIVYTVRTSTAIVASLISNVG